MCCKMQNMHYRLVKMTCLIQKCCPLFNYSFEDYFPSTPSLALGTIFCRLLPGKMGLIVFASARNPKHVKARRVLSQNSTLTNLLYQLLPQMLPSLLHFLQCLECCIVTKNMHISQMREARWLFQQWAET